MCSGRTYGILVRVYTPKVEEVSKRVDRALVHVRQILTVSEEFPALRRVMLLVPQDYDCGQTYHTLRSLIAMEGLQDRVGAYALRGYHSCEVLNQALVELSTTDSHALIVSGKAVSYLTVTSMRAIDHALEEGAKVAGLAVDELRDIVLDGRVQNTFAAWDVDALLGVGGFDCKTDVEEVAPIIRLARKFGLCIAPIDVESSALDVHTSASAKERHKQVMATKLDCQQAECERLGSDFESIHNATMA